MLRLARPICVWALAAAVAAACGGTPAPTQAPAGSQPASPSGAAVGTAVASSVPGGSASGNAGSSVAPGSSGQPTSSPALPTPLASLSADAAAGCSGNHDNRIFFEAIAGQVAWSVYCAVLPQGWFVQTGSFSLRGGGQMEITYRGPNGALLSLHEGNICTQGASACMPQGQPLGTTAFGDRTGTLVALTANGGYAIYVDPGASPSWSAVGTGLDQATFAGFAAALLRVQP